MQINHSLVRACWVSIVALLVCISLSAQQALPHPMHVVTHVDAIPAGATTFEDLIRSHVLPGIKESGGEFYTWRTADLGPIHRYALVAPMKSFAELDEPAPWTEVLGEQRTARFFSQVRPHVSAVRREVAIEREDLSYHPDGKFNMRRALVVRVTTKPGTLPQMEKMFREQITPAFREMKRGFAPHQVSIGGNPNHWVVLIQLDKFGDLDGGPFLLRQWGPEKFAQWTQEIAQYTTHETEYWIADLVSDLSVMRED